MVYTMRKAYNRPEMRAEALTMGVFGDYGNDNNGGGGSGGGGGQNGPIGWFFPLFGICCGGGGC